MGRVNSAFELRQYCGAYCACLVMSCGGDGVDCVFVSTHPLDANETVVTETRGYARVRVYKAA